MKQAIALVILLFSTLAVSGQTERTDSIINEVVPEKGQELRVYDEPNGSPLTLDHYPLEQKIARRQALEMPMTLQLDMEKERGLVLPPYMGVTLEYQHLFGLGSINRATFAYGTQSERWLLNASITGEKYGFYHTAFNNYVLGGSASYKLSDHWSLTAFGTYSTGSHFHSFAAYPYITQSQYGGTVNYQNQRFGMTLGARRYFDPVSRQWLTEPIVAPSVNMGKVKFEVDFGPVVYDILREAIGRSRHSGPTIMPNFPQR